MIIVILHFTRIFMLLCHCMCMIIKQYMKYNYDWMHTRMKLKARSFKTHVKSSRRIILNLFSSYLLVDVNETYP